LKANQTAKLLAEDKKGLIQMLPTVGMAVIILYAVMYIGTYMNGTIGSQLIETFPPNNNVSGWRTTFQNASVNTLNNLSGGYDSNVEIISVAAIITVLTIPLMAIVAVKKLV
jgi:hypothetical protein